MQLNLFSDSEVESDSPYILISLKEKMHHKILNGQKHYEYRKIFINTKAKVFLYITGKRKSICAYADFGDPIIGSLDTIIEVNKKDGSPNPSGIKEYFKDAKTCYAIPIIRYIEIPSITLEQLRTAFAGFAPPQSYIFLDRKPKLLEVLLTAINVTVGNSLKSPPTSSHKKKDKKE